MSRWQKNKTISIFTDLFNRVCAFFSENEFYVGALLKLSLELRTTQTTAVLLSVSEPEGYPALSLELNQGKVIISGDMGDRRPFRVEQSFQSEYAICDNKWHQIQAFYVEDKLTLKVDQFEQKYWLLDNGHITGARTHSPLYIGGLPGMSYRLQYFGNVVDCNDKSN